MQKNTDPVMKITIIPRTMGSLGYTMQVPEDDKYLMSKDEMLTEIAILFGGRAAEEVEFDSITTGASNDIERATNMARRMVTLYGMSESFDMMAAESVRNQYLDGRTVLSVSDRTAAKVDEETLNIIKSCHKKAIGILEEHHELMRELAEILLDKETITGSEFMHVVRQYMGEDFGLSRAEKKSREDELEAEKANDEAEIVHVEEEASAPAFIDEKTETEETDTEESGTVSENDGDEDRTI
jgi:cell division protease FtsH